LAIIRMLPRQELEQLIDAALELQMFVLLEAFDTRDIELAHELVDSRRDHHHLLLVGVNSRDLATLKVVPCRLDALASQLPTAVKRVAESGVATAEDAALMSASDPARLARAMLAQGRAAVSARARSAGHA